MDKPKSSSLFSPFRFSNMLIVCVYSVISYAAGSSIIDKRLVEGLELGKRQGHPWSWGSGDLSWRS